MIGKLIIVLAIIFFIFRKEIIDFIYVNTKPPPTTILPSSEIKESYEDAPTELPPELPPEQDAKNTKIITKNTKTLFDIK